ncbi:MAG TPA: glycine betaine ABC transporter substrate-binding protein, partial [Alphaproteobacteria bacterium]|nr:glycine betaine ABC transporter substrate-binding protein [Alphaproteobacteria bacterium]
TQGFYIPGYIQDEYGITKVSDLADPEIAKLFDIDDDGKGEYWAGVAGWETTYINQARAKSYGFDEYFEPLIISDAAFKAELKASIAREEGILFYYWTPEWLFAKYDLRQLEEPEFTGYAMENKQGDPNYNPDGCWKMYQPEERDDWLAASDVKCAWPDAKVYIGYSSAFEERAPEIAEFLNNVHFETDWVANWIAAIAVDQELPEDVAETWVEDNQDIVKGWLQAES